MLDVQFSLHDEVLMTEIHVMMWTSSRITRPNNERKPKIVLWTDSNGRLGSVIYDKQEPRYKKDVTNGDGNSVW